MERKRNEIQKTYIQHLLSLIRLGKYWVEFSLFIVTRSHTCLAQFIFTVKSNSNIYSFTIIHVLISNKGTFEMLDSAPTFGKSLCTEKNRQESRHLLVHRNQYERTIFSVRISVPSLDDVTQ